MWAFVFSKDLFGYFSKHWDVSDLLCLRATCKMLHAKIPALTPYKKQLVLGYAFEHFSGESKLVYLIQTCGYQFNFVRWDIIDKAIREDDPRILSCMMDCIDAHRAITEHVLKAHNYDIPKLLDFLLLYMKRKTSCRINCLIQFTLYQLRYIEWAFDKCIVTRHHFNDEEAIDRFCINFIFEPAYISGFSTLVQMMVDRKFNLRPFQVKLFYLDEDVEMEFFKVLTRIIRYCPIVCCQSSSVYMGMEFHESIKDFCECGLKKKKNNKRIKI